MCVPAMRLVWCAAVACRWQQWVCLLVRVWRQDPSGPPDAAGCEAAASASWLVAHHQQRLLQQLAGYACRVCLHRVCLQVLLVCELQAVGRAMAHGRAQVQVMVCRPWGCLAPWHQR